MSFSTSESSHLWFLPKSILEHNSRRHNSNITADSDENYSFYVSNEPKACRAGALSSRDEENLIVQNLPSEIEPDHHVSQVISEAIAKHAERVERQVELVENRFQWINDEIECRITDTSRVLDESLHNIDSLLSNFFKNRKSDEYMQFDLLRTFFLSVDELMDRRNGKIDDFFNAMRDLEKERTTLIEDCYERYMSEIKQLSPDSYERLYEKHLQNYNVNKLGNFRTYEQLRLKLIQLGKGAREEFALRAYDVKSKIKNDVAKNFIDKFRTAVAAGTITSDKISTSQTKSINLLRELNVFLNELTQKSKNRADPAFILKYSDSLQTYSNTLDAIVDSTIPLQDQVIGETQSLLKQTVDEFVEMIEGAGERLSPSELTAINDEMSALANTVQREKIKNVLDVQLFLNDVKNSIKAIYTMFRPALEITRGHLKRSLEARNEVSEALETTLLTNDLELNIWREQLNVALDSVVQVSNDTDVENYQQLCDDILENIKNGIHDNLEQEIELISSYKKFMMSELEVIRSEVRKTYILNPNNWKISIPEFKYATQNNWIKSINSAISLFKNNLKICQLTLQKCLSTFITEKKYSDFSKNEYAFTTSLEYLIDERFDVALQLLELRTIEAHDGICKKKLNDLEQHRILLERHIKAAQETSDNLRHDTKEMYKTFDRKTNDLILNKVALVESRVEELSTSELTVIIDALKLEIDSLADELNNKYKSHYDKVKSDYQAIEDTTLEFIKSVKIHSDGGNYGDEEAVHTVDALTTLCEKMSKEQHNILKLLKKHSYESTIEIKEQLLKMIKPLEDERNKKDFTNAYNSNIKLIHIALNQDVLNLKRKMDFLRIKLNNVKTVLEKDDVKESSKCWSEMLLETKAFMDFLLESYHDIKALLKSEINKSIWNSENEKEFISSVVSMNSEQTLSSGSVKFFDYCKFFIQPKTFGKPRFLNSVFLSIFHFISESQKNATGLASAQLSTTNSWISEKPDATQMYNEIMEEALRISKAIVLRAELVWIVTVSDFFDFLSHEYHATESEFKNVVLKTYHEESVTKMDAVFSGFEGERIDVRKHLKKIREETSYMLKPSHGHPMNAGRLENLVAHFHRVYSECLNTLTSTCAGTETKLQQTVKNYEKECPRAVFKAITLSVKSYSHLKTKLDGINIKLVEDDNEFDAMSETVDTRITDKDTVEQALNNVKSYLRKEPGAVFWPKNKVLWANNVKAISKLCHDRRADVQVFDAVEKSKLLDWATRFVRDVELVKNLYHSDNDCRTRL